MSENKQILIVDDHYSVRESLRSMLEFSQKTYQVIGVSSAEEAILLLQTSAYDLLITDLRLERMNGFDLIRHTQQIAPQMPIILATANDSLSEREEAESLGVYRFFIKPLDTKNLLKAVHEAVYGIGLSAGMAKFSADIAAKINHRLKRLQMETQAIRIVLSDLNGEILFDNGDEFDLKMPAFITSLAGKTASNLQNAKRLSQNDPQLSHYLEGDRVDLFLTNVGWDYLLALFFDAQVKRGRIGTAWVFCRRVSRELKELMVETVPPATIEKPLPAENIVTAPSNMPAISDHDPVLTELVDSVDFDLDMELSEFDPDFDLDSFWEDGDKGNDAGNNTPQNGMSLTEAIKQGLISSDFAAGES